MRYVIGGTCCPHWGGVIFYNKLLTGLGADLIALPRFGLGPIDETVDDVIKIIERRYRNEPKVDLVGHSQGGLVAVGVANERPDLVDRVVSIAAPLSGAFLASRFNPVPAVRDMAPHSRFISKLYGTKDTLVVSAEHDLVVQPAPAAALEDTEWIVGEKRGHLSVCLDDELIERIDNFLSREGEWEEESAA